MPTRIRRDVGGVRLNKKAETWRDRRISREEEKRLLDAALAMKHSRRIPLVLRLQLPDLSKAVDLELKETVKPTLEALDGLNRLGIPLALN
jgi:hypothetical protein